MVPGDEEDQDSDAEWKDIRARAASRQAIKAGAASLAVLVVVAVRVCCGGGGEWEWGGAGADGLETRWVMAAQRRPVACRAAAGRSIMQCTAGRAGVPVLRTSYARPMQLLLPAHAVSSSFAATAPWQGRVKVRRRPAT